MGNCIYCGKSAGLLSNKHSECENQFYEKQRIINVGRKEIINKIVKTINGLKSFEELDIEIPLIEQSFFVPSAERKFLLINGWEVSINHFLEDRLLDSKEETRLVNFKERYNLSQEELDLNGAYTRIAKASIIRDVLNGIVPEQLSVQGNLPINFQKGEKIIWAFAHSDYLEDKTLRTYIGTSKGVSVRIMKGVYYRVGAFQGKAIEHVERVHIDNGWVAITNSNIYFAGTQKSVRIPYVKIISFEPFSNGIGIIRDSSTAKPQIFVTGDGWFTYNLVTNLAKL